MHRIRRQILDLELPREAGAVALQRQMGRVFQEQVLPQLDALFDRIAPPDRYIRIEQLEIDMGVINEDYWEQQFIEECVRQIARQVTEATFDPGTAAHPHSVSLSPEARALEVLRYFLEAGALPWYARKMALKTVEELVLHSINTDPVAFSRDFLPLLKQNATVRQRLFWQFSPAFVAAVIEASLGLSPGWMSRAEQILQIVRGRKMNGPERLAFFRVLLDAAPAQGMLPQLPEAPWVTRLFYESQSGTPETKVLSGANSPEILRPQTRTGAGSTLNTSGDEVPDTAGGMELPAEATPRVTEAYMSDQTGWDTRQNQPLPETDRSPGHSQPILPSLQQKNAFGGPRRALEVETLYIDHAGLVLLAVYLPAFFEALAFTEGKAFAGPEQQYRAVHLLHYLATRLENPEEPVLVLPKILCGMDIETPVPAEIQLLEAEKTECNQLLEAVIRNWPVLKNTSPDGLRSGFLQRMGQLSRTESGMGWLLRPEKLGQDLLLDRLPWTYSVVRLPWMPSMVQVEW